MRKPNIVIIVLDTLREDHAQGLDRLLDYGFVKYQNAIAPAPWTLPSHASMFTGLYPSEHGIHEKRRSPYTKKGRSTSQSSQNSHASAWQNSPTTT
jgi:arylsulfatase A-like enzyme